MDNLEHNVSVTIEKVSNGFFVNFPTWKEVAKDERDLANKISESLVEGITNLSNINKTMNVFKVNISLTTK